MVIREVGGGMKFGCRCGALMVIDVDNVPTTHELVVQAMSAHGWKPSKPAGFYLCPRCTHLSPKAAP